MPARRDTASDQAQIRLVEGDLTSDFHQILQARKRSRSATLSRAGDNVTDRPKSTSSTEDDDVVPKGRIALPRQSKIVLRGHQFACGTSSQRGKAVGALGRV